RVSGATGPKSITAAPRAPAVCTTMKPVPPSPLFHGSTAASAKAAAATASTALPPAARIAAPVSAAVPCCAATIPLRDTATGFLISQFCVRRTRPDGANRAALFVGLERGHAALMQLGVGDRATLQLHALLPEPRIAAHHRVVILAGAHV